jgi:hypothetical protein
MDRKAAPVFAFPFTKFSPGLTEFDVVVTENSNNNSNNGEGEGEKQDGNSSKNDNDLGFQVALGKFLPVGSKSAESGWLVVSSVVGGGSNKKGGRRDSGIFGAKKNAAAAATSSSSASPSSSSVAAQGLAVGHAVVGINGVRWPEKGVPSDAAFRELCSHAARPLVVHVVSTAAAAKESAKGAAKSKAKAATTSSTKKMKKQLQQQRQQHGGPLEMIGEDREEEEEEEEEDKLGSETPERQRLTQTNFRKGFVGAGQGGGGGVLVKCTITAPKLGLDLAARTVMAGGDKIDGMGKDDDDEETMRVQPKEKIVVEEVAAGVVVASLGSNSEAQLLGVKVGDRVVKVNATNVAINLPHKNVAALIRLSGRPLTLVFERRGVGSLPGEGEESDDDDDDDGKYDDEDNEEKEEEEEDVKAKRRSKKGTASFYASGAVNEFTFNTYAASGLECVSAAGGRLLVAAVASGSPVEAAGVLRHDEVVAVNGVPWLAETVGNGSGSGGDEGGGADFLRNSSSDGDESASGGGRRGSTMLGMGGGGGQQQQRRGSVVAMRRASSVGGGGSGSGGGSILSGAKKDPAEVLKDILTNSARPLVLSLRRGTPDGPNIPVATEAAAPRKRFSLLSR